MSQQPGQSSQRSQPSNIRNDDLPPIREVLEEYFPPESSPQSGSRNTPSHPDPGPSFVMETGRPQPPSQPRQAQRTGPYRCPDCNFAADRPSALEVHRRSHDDATLFNCPHCPKSFKTSSNRNRHIRSHSASKQIVDVSDSEDPPRPYPGTGKLNFGRK